MKHQKNSKKGSGMKIQKESKSVKRTILAVVFMAFSVFMTQGQTAPTPHDGNVTLRTQADVDAFNHSSISGYLDISDGLTNFITNIDNLTALTNVGGYVLMASVSFLTSLSGFDNLTSIGGALAIYTCDALTSLTGLESINSIGGELYIGISSNGVANNNPALVDYCAISGLVTSDITDGSDGSTNKYFVANNGYNPTYAQIQSVAGCSSATIVLSKIYAYSATGGGSSGTALTLAELNSTGITSIIAANLDAYNTAIVAKTDFADPATDSIDTLAELQVLIISVNLPVVLRKIYTYSASGGGSTGTALTLAELNSIGVTDIIATNLVAYNTAIAAKTDFADPATDSVDTLAELQALITSVNGSVVGLFDYSSKSLVRLSPNPAIGFVSFFGLSSEEDYVIYNTLGVAVQSGIVFSEEKISIESLHAGLYFLKLGKLEVFKFLKE